MSDAMRTFRLVATLAAMLGGAAPSLAQQRTPIPSCSLGDTDWRRDPVFLRSQNPSARGRPGGALRCEQYDLSEYPVGAERLKVVVGRLFETGEGGGAGIEQPVRLIILSKGTGAQERVIGRFLEPYDISRDKPNFFTQLATTADGGALVLVGWQIRTAYLVRKDEVRLVDSHAWLDAAIAATPPGWRAGPVRTLKPDSLDHNIKGYVALFRADADDPSRPGRADDEGQAIEVDLVVSETRLVAVNTRVVEGNSVQDDEWWERFVSQSEGMRSDRRRLPRGTETCDITAWSMDPDPAGMTLRAAPNAQARAIGRIPPPWKAPDRLGDRGQTYRSQFRVIGSRPGWFLVRDITAPGVAYGERYPRTLPQAPRGQGWVAASLIGAALANTGLARGELRQAPSEFSAIRPVAREPTPIGPGDVVERLHACSGNWGLVEIGGERGWWRGICANQVSNCS